MKVAPFLSIIVPTYNSEVTIKKCLDSIISQSFSDFEVLIIDRLSIDDTLKIAENYYDSRINIISENDNGIYDAMNKGIKQAKGDWLYFLGSDDTLYDKDVFKKIYSVVHSTNKKIIYGNVIFKGNVHEIVDGSVYDGYFTLGKLFNHNICHQSIFYHKTVFLNMGNFNINYTLYADWDFNLRCKAKYKFEYSDMISAFFNVYGSSYSLQDNNFHSHFLENIAKYFRWQFYKIDLFPFFKNVLKDQIKRRNFGVAFFICFQMILFHPFKLISKLIAKS